MTEIIVPLTEDERAVLMIAANGESMMAIGRWEPTIDRLVQRGLMARHDRFNNVITDRGREASAATERAIDVEVRQALGSPHEPHPEPQPIGIQAPDQTLVGTPVHCPDGDFKVTIRSGVIVWSGKP